QESNDPQDQASADSSATATATTEDGVEVREAEFPDAGRESRSGQEGKIDLILDAVIPITVQIGAVEMSIRDLLKLGSGSVLKLDKRIGQPVDLFIRGIRFATGDVVVIGDQLGVRIREILSNQEMENVTI
ncbi:MAG: FliM/FliN family flagellar motor switch protein, partial [Phycisphaerae bacterium]